VGSHLVDKNELGSTLVLPVQKKGCGPGRGKEKVREAAAGEESSTREELEENSEKRSSGWKG